VKIIKRQTFVGAFFDALISPFMYFFSGVWVNLFKGPTHWKKAIERPQRTHRYNNHHYPDHILNHLDQHLFVHVQGNSEEKIKKHNILFHLPLLGGWKKYTVFKPQDHSGEWFIGWRNDEVFGCSRIPILGEVRVLKGRYGCNYFGVTEEGTTIPTEKIADGTVGDGSQYRMKMLL
jgi:hypothetical protein